MYLYEKGEFKRSIEDVKGRDKSNENARSTGTWRAPMEEVCVPAGDHDERERKGTTYHKPARGRESTERTVETDSDLTAVNSNKARTDMCDSAVTCPFCVQVSEAFIYLKKIPLFFFWCITSLTTKRNSYKRARLL